ncbi:MAG: 4Fe-4S binding protein [Candidatus Omnitrophota bacterium]|nr:4Fe-4S binding protein [Candidatus Omnitrophota bacterium]
MKKLVVLRRTSQLAFFILFIYAVIYPFSSYFSSLFFSAINPNLTVFISISEKIFLPRLTVSLVMILLTLVLGRFFCGWICPMGTFLDSASIIRKKNKNLSDNRVGKLRYMKFFVLGAVFISSLTGGNMVWFFDPLVNMSRFVLFFRNKVTDISGIAITGILFLLIYVSAFFIPRLWCRVLCPLGAIYAFFSKFSLLKRKVSACANCDICKIKCRMGAIKDNADYIKGECVLCMDCVYDCPERITKFTLKK